MWDKRSAELLMEIIRDELYTNRKIDQDIYPIPEWATHQIIRASGLIEDVCIHKCGHPNRNWLKLHDPDGSKGYGIHGCCEGSCCMKNLNKEELDK